MSMSDQLLWVKIFLSLSSQNVIWWWRKICENSKYINWMFEHVCSLHFLYLFSRHHHFLLLLLIFFCCWLFCFFFITLNRFVSLYLEWELCVDVNNLNISFWMSWNLFFTFHSTHTHPTNTDDIFGYFWIFLTVNAAFEHFHISHFTYV